MKFAFPILLFFALIASCTEEKPFKLSFSAEELEGFAAKSTFESFYSSKDSSCIEVITYDQLKSRKEITVKLGKHCDSVEITIPAGGTITSASLYTDSINRNSIAEVPGFSLMDFGNHFTVSSKLRGRYYLHYGSCHWGSEMWVNFE